MLVTCKGNYLGDFLRGPSVKTSHLQCRGQVQSLLRELDHTRLMVQPKKCKENYLDNQLMKPSNTFTNMTKSISVVTKITSR